MHLILLTIFGPLVKVGGSEEEKIHAHDMFMVGNRDMKIEYVLQFYRKLKILGIVYSIYVLLSILPILVL